MLLSQLLRSAGVVYTGMTGNDTEISGIVSDSRRAAAGSLYVCIRGTKTDGHMYIADAASRGAVAVLALAGHTATVIPDGITAAYTPDTRAALARLWNAWYGFPGEGMHLVAVTGTNGKTTVTYMLRAIFKSAMLPCGIIGTVRCETPLRTLDVSSPDINANMTTPDPEQLYAVLCEMKRDGAEYVFIEATSHALALRKLEPLTFDAAVFTNLTPEHLDFHGSMENYFLAKAALLGKCKLAIINIDDKWGERYVAHARTHGCACDIGLTSAISADADFRATSVRDIGAGGITYVMRSDSAIRSVRCPVPGAFTVMNSLQAAACATLLGIGGRYVTEALAAFCGTPGRLERVRLGGGYPASLFIDYAHTPDALENLLRAARGFTPVGCRLWLVFGCGGDRDRQKRAAMGRIASETADFTLITSDNSRSENPRDIIADILGGFDAAAPHAVIPSRRDAIAYAVENAGRGDVILLAGKGHEQYEIDAAGRHPFDEKAVAADAAQARMSREAAARKAEKVRESKNED